MDDLISRGNAIRAVHDNYDSILEFVSTGKTISASVEDILNGLSAEQPRKGEWIPIYRKRTGKVIAQRCSQCLRSPKYGVKSDFCPNCGADMRVKDESIDKRND